MEKLTKIAIYTGMTIAISIFILFVISILPYIVDQIRDNWDEILPISKEEVLQKFYKTESYQAFIKKYPQNGRYIDIDDNRGRLEISAMNFETLNVIRLELRYYSSDDNVREEVICSNDKYDMNYRVRGSLAVQFIEKVECITGDGLVRTSSPLDLKNNEPIPERIVDKNYSYNYDCGDGTTFDEGICLVN